MSGTPIGNTIKHLRLCREARDAGLLIHYISDPTWLVNMAINRRAGWPDDPSLLRGSAMPVNGQYPKRASGDDWAYLRRFARQVNTPRLRVYESDCPRRLRGRFEHRLSIAGEY